MAQQRQAMKKAGLPAASAAPSRPARKKPGRKPGRKPAARAAAPAAQAPAARPAQRGPVELIDRLFELTDDVGGIGALKRLVDRIATVERA